MNTRTKDGVLHFLTREQMAEEIVRLDAALAATQERAAPLEGAIYTADAELANKRAAEQAPKTIARIIAGEAGEPIEAVSGAAVIKRVIHELRTYNPAADEYKGAYIHEVWAKELQSALNAAPESPLPLAPPPGYALVPLEPTVEMTRAAARWLAHIHVMRAIDRTNAINDAYRAMVTAGQGDAK